MSKKVLIYGGRGALGSTMVSHFQSCGWWVCSVDLAASDAADANVIVDPKADWLAQEELVVSEVGKAVGGDKLDAVLNVAGGWAGGNASSAEFIKNCDMMWKQSVWSSTIAAAVAAKHSKPGGCLVLPGAQPATAGTPGMIGYGMAKAAIHQLVKSLADSDKSGLPEGTFTAAILPITLDTPMNRKWMPKADQTTWTKLEFIADLMQRWAEGKDRPQSGSLIQLVTKGGVTELVNAD